MIGVTLIGFGTVGKAILDLFLDDKDLKLETIVVTEGFEELIPKEFDKLIVPWKEFIMGSSRNFFVCIGYQELNTIRQEIYSEALTAGHNPIALVHERAFISRSAKLGNGVLVMPGTTIENNTEVGDGTFIWSGTVVGHDSTIGDFSFISANVAIGGGAKLGKNCVVGLGSILGNRILVGDRSLIGAGVLTTLSMPEDSVVIRGSDRIIDLPTHEFLKLTNFDDVN